MSTSNKILTEHNAKVVVLDFINALNAEDFDLARQQLQDDMTFKGVIGVATFNWRFNFVRFKH